jgi:hypothetical protein
VAPGDDHGAAGQGNEEGERGEDDRERRVGVLDDRGLGADDLDGRDGLGLRCAAGARERGRVVADFGRGTGLPKSGWVSPPRFGAGWLWFMT